MLNVTEAAGDYLNRVLDNANASPDTAVRLTVEQQSLTAALDNERPGDTTFDHEGRKVLLLDELASNALADSKLDVQPTPDGPTLEVV